MSKAAPATLLPNQASAHRALPSEGPAAPLADLSDEERPEVERPAVVTAPDWSGLVARIRAGDQNALSDLYTVFAKGIRYFLLRNLGPEDLDDKVHDCFLAVAQAIQNGELREPERLMGYVRTIVKRKVAASIEVAVQQRRSRVEFDETMFSVSDWRDNPESSVLAQQRLEIARKVLNGVSRRDREILNRFYVLEQSQEQICLEMGLSYNQFRLLKSRAKARFGELGKRLAAGAGIQLRKF